MDFFDVVKKRRSVRKFTQKEVPKEVIELSLDAALLAPNSSNMQPWDFYWVRDPSIRLTVVEACFSQSAAKSAAEIVVAVCRLDTWKKHRHFIIEKLRQDKTIPPSVLTYYEKIVPLSYIQDPFGFLGAVKKIVFSFIGLFKAVPRGPFFRADLLEVVSKSTALACENFMLALTAQGFDSCPMEGFDELRLKKILKLNCRSHVVMVIGIGEADPQGIIGKRSRVPRDWVVHTI